ncbi:protein patched [Neocloeon triangulifer]|uniref:protein patched n=1 Tax=Neocloeon triangulifer TaxID=2078957 RepID=UPI00286F5403|nr:protein patched [Neocloeon triangulifer]
MTPAPEASSDQQGCCRPPEDKHTSDLYTRTSWVDAALALSQIDKGKASGRRAVLWVRSVVQQHLFQLGCFVQRYAGIVLFFAALLLAACIIGLKSAKFETKVDKLWVEEGGRLERELLYTKQQLGEDASTTTHQLVIQTPRDPEASVLHPSALLAHLDVLRAASAVTIHMFDVTWRLKDFCYGLSFPSFEKQHIDVIFESLSSCAIITPLDCFWEGSKLLGPYHPVTLPGGSHWTWKNLNPQELLEQMEKTFGIQDPSFPYRTLEDFMKRAGITTGYQYKPCLNPMDPECPETAPNKGSPYPPNIGSELTGGCYGYASRFMHSPEELIVGGAKFNTSSGHMLRAKALQTVIQLVGPNDMFEYWQRSYKVDYKWTPAKAAAIINAWQKKFTDVLNRLVQGEAVQLGPEEEHDFNPNKELNQSHMARLSNFKVVSFSSSSLDELVAEFSELSIPKLAAGYLLVLVYAACALIQLEDVVKSQSAVGIAGVFLIGLTVTAGLGVCAMLGMPFNATTTQILPFLALGLGMSDLFLLTQAYADQDHNHGKPAEQTGHVLKKAGINVLLGSLSKIGVFFAAAIIPIPALRNMPLQAAILMLFHLLSMLFVMPALISFDLMRRRAMRSDLLCYQDPVRSQSNAAAKPDLIRPIRQSITRALPPDRHIVTTVLAPEATVGAWERADAPLKPSSLEDGWPVPACVKKCPSLKRLAQSQYGPTITNPAVKAIVMLLLIVVLVLSGFGALRLKDGLELTELVPAETDEHNFLSVQRDYFGFYSMYAVTQNGFEYPSGQKLLHEYHNAFLQVEKVLRNDDGGLPPFWLSLFRDWLIDLQNAFERDWHENRITTERWFSNASDQGILAYKLLVQTGRVEHPIDKSLLTRAKLVDNAGIINPRAFYNYLSAWTANDALSYSASQANLRPEPKMWYHEASDYELKIPKSQPIAYAQMPFYLHDLHDTAAMKDMIKQVRKLCAKFEDKGLPNYPIGIPFMFWEQYLGLRQSLAVALVVALAAVSITILALLLNPWMVLLVAITLASCALQVLGMLGAFGIPLSAVTGVITVLGVGIAAQPCLHISLSFLTAIGNRNRRVRLSLEHMMAPVIHGAATALLSVVMLAFSRFDFIVKYFFLSLLGVQVVSLVNGLLFFPVLLSIFGPMAMVVPHEFEDRISTPTPSPPRKRRTSQPSSTRNPRRPIVVGQQSSSQNCAHHCREPSLSTISEEPNSYQSNTHEVVVKPELVVQTMTHHYHHNHPPPAHGVASCPEGCPAAAPKVAPQGCSKGCPSAANTSVPPPQTGHMTTTRVTATAKFKVEVHTPALAAAGPINTSASTSSSTSSSMTSTSDESGDSGGRLS